MEGKGDILSCDAQMMHDSAWINLPGFITFLEPKKHRVEDVITHERFMPQGGGIFQCWNDPNLGKRRSNPLISFC